MKRPPIHNNFIITSSKPKHDDFLTHLRTYDSNEDISSVMVAPKELSEETNENLVTFEGIPNITMAFDVNYKGTDSHLLSGKNISSKGPQFPNELFYPLKLVDTSMNSNMSTGMRN